MAGSNATRRVDQIHWNVTLGWIVERNICKMLGWQSILTKVVPRSGTISWEGILLRYECSKRPICIPGAYNDQRCLALACTVNSAHQSDQFRSRAQSHLKPPATNSINLIGNVTTVFLSFLLLPFPLRIYQAVKRGFIFVANSRIYSFFFFTFFLLAKHVIKYILHWWIHRWGIKYPLKLLVNRVRTGFDFVYDLNCIANLTERWTMRDR